MKVYTEKIIKDVQSLRLQGKTYREINQILGLSIPKSTLSYYCRNVDPGENYRKRIQADTAKRLAYVQELAVAKNRQIFESKLAGLRKNSQYAASLIREIPVAKIALAMLYLGEGAKWKSHRAPQLGSSDPRIIKIYLSLLETCYKVERKTIRCAVQHRADQDSTKLLNYWSKIMGIPKKQFYPSYIDKRTIGKPTKKTDYKGVCVVNCPGTHIQLELDIMADIISDAWGIGAVG